MAASNLPSPMAGSVKEVLVSPGDAMHEGDEVILLESMKMEIPVEAPRDGTVLEVLVTPGETIDEGAPLLRFEG